MAKKKITISRFDGGITDTPRDQTMNKCSVVKHFDIYSNPYKLTPYRDTEDDMHDGSTSTGMKQYDVRNFQYGSDGKLYGIGHQLGGDATKSWVFLKADPTSGNWTAPDNAYKSTIAGGASWPECFIEWQGRFYSFATGKVIACPLAGTYDDAVLTPGSTITSVAQGVIGADGNLYLFYNNKVVRVNSAGTATDNVCSALPSDMKINSVCPYGGFLAIGMASLTSGRTSKIFLWDYVTTTTVYDVIDWGEGDLMVLGNIEGHLVGVTDKYLSSSLGITTGAMVVKMWSGGIPRVMKEIISPTSVSAGRFLRNYVVKNNRLYWVASVPFGANTTTTNAHIGIWSFGRKNENFNWSLALDYIEDGLGATDATYRIMSFGNAGNYWFFNYLNDGSISKTNDATSSNYTTNSIFETNIFGDGKTTKKLIGVTVMMENQPSAGSITLKYKKNGCVDWRTIFTDSTDYIQSHQAVNIETGTTSTVTMSIASPCVVTLANHGLLPGDVFYFTTSAGGLPTGVAENTNYTVLSAGFTTGTFRFSLTKEGTAINSSGSQSGTHTLHYNTELGEFKEVEFQIISTGGTVITGFEYEYKSVDDSKY